MKLWIKDRIVESMLAVIFAAYLISSSSGGTERISKQSISKLKSSVQVVDAKDYYLKNTYRETGGGNIVAGIYLDYRLFDSLLEAGILLISASGIIFISKKDDEV